VELDEADLRLAHAGLAHALARAVDQHREVGALHAPHRQELFLRGDPVRHVQVDQRLACGHGVERRTNVEVFDIAGGPCLNDRLVALVEGDGADRGDLRREHALGHAQCVV